MIYPLVHGSTSFLLCSALWLANVLAVRVLVPRAFGTRRFFVAVVGGAFVVLGAHAAWAFFLDRSAFGRFGITIASAAPVFLALVLLSVPLAGAIAAIGRVLARTGRPPATIVSDAIADAPPAPSDRAVTPDLEAAAEAVSAPGRPTRRAVIALAASAAPVAAVAVGARGFANGFSPVRIVPRELSVPRLPPALDGLTIAQLGDVHLGVYRQLPDLERALAVVASSKPDLVVLTGDFVEHGDLLADALRLVKETAPKHGVFACLGNHEYFQRIRDVRRLYDALGVPLLVDDAASIRIGDERIAIVGLDDPRSMRGDIHGSLARSLDKGLLHAHGATRLLLSHRPEAVVPASEADVALVLSGHTHGGQIGFNGKSAFEAMTDDGYLWGAYLRANTRLYTTSGFGHWYPFRLGCESELPIVTLRRGGASGSSAIALR